MRPLDLTGKRFGTLIVQSFVERRGSQAMWLCLCDCGREAIKSLGNLRSGHTKSCGCLRSIVTTMKKTTHGMHGTPAYKSWQAMLLRCTNPKNHKFKDYGARGIKVCPEWISFEQFFKDMGDRPPETTLGRIDNDGDYTPANCEWQGHKTQARNKRNTALFEYQGRIATLAEHCERLGLNCHSVRSRIYIYKWTVEKAFSTPIATKPKPNL